MHQMSVYGTASLMLHWERVGNYSFPSTKWYMLRMWISLLTSGSAPLTRDGNFWKIIPFPET